MNDILELLKWSPPLLLIVALNALGMSLKKAAFIDNKWIPLILPTVGAVVYTGIGAASPLPYIGQINHPWMIYALIGFVTGGIAVWGHQAVTNLVTGRTPKTTSDNNE